MTPDELIGEVVELISLPRAYHRISEMMDDPRYGAADIGKVIAHDPALTARLLKMVNSAYYHFPSKIDTVPMAITVLGTRSLRELVLATSVASAFSHVNTRLVDVADFWHHSIYCGILARLLSRRLKVGGQEQLFIAGLLHDLGKLVLYTRLPDESNDILRQSAETGQALHEVEREVLGFDHGEVGAALMRKWQLPEVFPATAAFHHRPDQADEFLPEVCLVHAANALTKKVEPGYKVRSAAEEMPLLHPLVASHIPLGHEQVEELRLEADVMSIEVFSTLFAGSA